MGSGMNSPQLHPAISLRTNPDHDNLTFIFLKWEEVAIDPHQNDTAAAGYQSFKFDASWLHSLCCKVQIRA